MTKSDALNSKYVFLWPASKYPWLSMIDVLTEHVHGFWLRFIDSRLLHLLMLLHDPYQVKARLPQLAQPIAAQLEHCDLVATHTHALKRGKFLAVDTLCCRALSKPASSSPIIIRCKRGAWRDSHAHRQSVGQLLCFWVSTFFIAVVLLRHHCWRFGVVQGQGYSTFNFVYIESVH